MAIVSRFLLLKPNTVTKQLSSSRSLFTTTTTTTTTFSSLSSLDGLRPRLFEPAVRALAVRRLYSSLNEQMQSTKNFNYTRVDLPKSPPREGSDLKPYIVFTVPPSSEYSRDELIEGYVRLLYCFWGSKKDAKEKIYSVSTRFYYTFGALLTKEQVKYFESCIGIREVLPDSHFDVENMEYGDTKLFGGEPFINGKAVPYDPKYHEAWIRTNGEKDYEEEDYESEDDDFGVDHWSVVMEEPKSYLSRDEIIDSYIKTLAGALGSEEEARKQLYSVSTRVSYSFGARLFYCSAQKLKNMPGVKSVRLDVDVEDKKYGEPFINGEAVPYDPKYHEKCETNSCPKFDWFNNIGKEERESPKRKSKDDEQSMKKRDF